jgi:hypothetical protein
MLIHAPPDFFCLCRCGFFSIVKELIYVCFGMRIRCSHTLLSISLRLGFSLKNRVFWDVKKGVGRYNPLAKYTSK